jgi:predicted transposase/invertase (TIGR01784 family)
MTERLNPLNDFLFFKVMGEKGDEVQLLSFLNAVLGRTENPIVSVEILENKTFSAEVIGDKSSILDTRAVLQDNTRVNIEVQLQNPGNMDRRSLFYWSREYTFNLEKGHDYRELPNVAAVNIVDFELIPAAHFHTSFHLWEDRKKDLLLTEALEIHFIDMVKFRKVPEKDVLRDPLQRWLTWFDRNSPAKLVEEVVKMDKAIEKAEKRIEHVTKDKEALRAYYMRQMALSDWTSSINHAREEGLQEGIEQGRREEKLAAAHALKAIGMPVGQIVQVTGLTEAEIRGKLPGSSINSVCP